MRTSIWKWITAIAVIVAGQQLATGKDSANQRKVGNLERVIVYAIQVEAQASQIKSRTDLCVGLGHGLAADEKTVVAELVQSGLRVHPNAQCSQAPRALRIAVVSPIAETSAGEYKLVLELGDMSIKSSEHFATLLRRGTYVVRLQGGSKPQLVSYQETCCAKTD